MKLELDSNWIRGVKVYSSACPFCGQAFVLFVDEDDQEVENFMCPHVRTHDHSTVTFTGFVVGARVAVVEDMSCRIGRLVSWERGTMTVSFQEPWGSVSQRDFPKDQVYPIKGEW